MDNAQLKDYVAQNLAQGMRPEEVRAALVSQGWSGADIDQALGAPTVGAPKAAGSRRRWPIIITVVVVLVLGSIAALATFRNPAKPVAIEVPVEVKDVEEESGLPKEDVAESRTLSAEEARSDDAKRFTDVRQIQTALELAFSEANDYPIVGGPILIERGHTDVLCMDRGAPTWMSDAATCTGTVFIDLSAIDPAPEGGTYVYAGGSAGTYTLQFSLLSGREPLGAGPHCANQNGIESRACATGDQDYDGLSDADEAKYLSDPDDPDTDDDGYMDGAEVSGGYDPNGPNTL